MYYMHVHTNSEATNGFDDKGSDEMECKGICPELEKWIRESRDFRRREKEMEIRVDKVSGLVLNEFYLLYYLERNPEHKLRQQEAQELIQMSQSAMSRLIQRLEGLDPSLVTRCTCDLDKRGIYVQLTDAGHEVYSRIAEACRDILVEDDNK